MKYITILAVLASIVIASSSANSRFLLQQRPINRGICRCTREFDPLCCDGQTYDNPCLADCDGIDSNQCLLGPCVGSTEPCICTLIFDPICCNNNQYDNPCFAACDGVIVAAECTDGPCATSTQQPGNTDCICTLEYDPICCDGITYGNRCAAECDGMIPSQCISGECVSTTDCICTAEFDPICCDGNDYANSCNAECDGYLEPAINDPSCSIGLCSSDPCICTLEQNPICCNGVQYVNPCNAECDGITPQIDCVSGPC